jgi:hypothetical protein
MMRAILSRTIQSERLRPNPPMQPTPLRVGKIAAILAPRCAQTSFRSISSGAADGQLVGLRLIEVSAVFETQILPHNSSQTYTLSVPFGNAVSLLYQPGVFRASTIINTATSSPRTVGSLCWTSGSSFALVGVGIPRCGLCLVRVGL